MARPARAPPRRTGGAPPSFTCSKTARRKGGAISPSATVRVNSVLWFSDLRGSTAISENLTPDEIIPFLNDYAQAAIDAIHDEGSDVLKLIGDGVLAMFTSQDMTSARRAALRAEHRFRRNMA